MDVVSHFLLPYAAALAFLGAARKRSREIDGDAAARVWEQRAAIALVFGVGGFLPDLDAAYGWLRHADGFYFLQHRGFSHSLPGAAIHGIAGAGFVALAAQIWRRRLGWLHWRAAYLPASVLGAMTHLLLDSITYMGVPLLWPLSLERHSLQLFPWLYLWMFVLSSIILALHLLRRMPHNRLVKLSAVLFALLLIAGAVRLDARPVLAEGETAYPRSSSREWIVVTPDPDENGAWFVQLNRNGVPIDPQWHNASRIEPGSEAAVRFAEASHPYRGLLMNTAGPLTVETTRTENGAWQVNFTAIVARYDAVYGARWTPASPTESWGLLSMEVDPGNKTWMVDRWGW